MPTTDYVIAGKVTEDGRLVPTNKNLFRVMVNNLRDKKVEIVIRPMRKLRSLNQNAYYFGVIVPLLAEEWGYADPDELHNALAMKFLAKHGPNGMVTRRSTATLSTAEFTEYLDRIITWVEADFGINVPRPQETELHLT